MRARKLTEADYRTMPWKNGRGVTTEIARSPESGEFHWRVSVASVVEDGPFSHFPGCDRVILALDGEGMVLTQRETGVRAELGPLEPWEFSGDLGTSCALRGGPFRDFNVIVRRNAFRASVEVLRPGGEVTLEEQTSPGILYCARGRLHVEGGAATTTLARGETLFADAGGPERLLLRSTGEETPILIRVVLAPL